MQPPTYIALRDRCRMWATYMGHVAHIHGPTYIIVAGAVSAHGRGGRVARYEHACMHVCTGASHGRGGRVAGWDDVRRAARRLLPCHSRRCVHGHMHACMVHAWCMHAWCMHTRMVLARFMHAMRACIHAACMHAHVQVTTSRPGLSVSCGSRTPSHTACMAASPRMCTALIDLESALLHMLLHIEDMHTLLIV